MGDTVLANIEREFNWLANFDVLIWSYQHNMAKPDPAIYKLALERLGTPPEETLFIDDKQPNIDAARALGLVGILFSTVEHLREQIIAEGLDRELPLPA
jgi:HAD superfamily hydrolase (TIGR01509 family)